MSQLQDHYDVIVVGAGLSGIDAAYRIQTMCPGKSYVVLEARSQLGGTWDLFKYPGIRSDSDMYTLGLPFEPWLGGKSIADGGSILQYLKDTAAKYGIDEKIVFDSKVVHAAWSSVDAQWTLTVRQPDGERKVTATHLYLCSGYYDYDTPYTPEFAGREDFAGQIIHPQFWPEGLDVAGKKITIIGSGATAITLGPSLAALGAQVTMLQRSPTYILSLPDKDPVGFLVRKRVDPQKAYSAVRMKNAAQTLALYQICRLAPKTMAKMLRRGALLQSKGADVSEKDFTPPYDPWDQRLCVVPNADFFKQLKKGDLKVVTDTTEGFTTNGVRTGSAEVIESDIVVTATGLKMLAAGGMTFESDGEPLDVATRYIYRGMMVSGLPNFAMCVGYTNASWTLRADLSSQYFCRFMNLIDERGYAYGYPHVEVPMKAGPALDLTSGYVQREVQHFPKQGDRAPWFLHQNYFRDRRDNKKADLEQDMVFVRAGEDHTIREAAAPATL